MENNVYTEVNLLALLEEKKLKGIRYGLEERYMDAKTPVVYLDRLEDVLDVATETKQPVIFYKYHYLKPKDLMIDEELLDDLYTDMAEKELDEGIAEELQEQLDERVNDAIETYNKKVIDTNLKQPTGLTVFCLYEGNRVLYIVMDFRVLKENNLHLFPEEALSEIMITNILENKTFSSFDDEDIIN